MTYFVGNKRDRHHQQSGTCKQAKPRSNHTFHHQQHTAALINDKTTMIYGGRQETCAKAKLDVASAERVSSNTERTRQQFQLPRLPTAMPVEYVQAKHDSLEELQ